MWVSQEKSDVRQLKPFAKKLHILCKNLRLEVIQASYKDVSYLVPT